MPGVPARRQYSGTRGMLVPPATELPRIDRLLADVAAALVPTGMFLCSILHPCFFGQAPTHDPQTDTWYRRVTGYLAPEQRWVDSFGGHTHYHRPLSWYIQQITGHGLVVTALHEPPTLPERPKPPTDWDAYERWFSTIPTMLVLACRPMPTTE
jgi:hypothetical protein